MGLQLLEVKSLVGNFIGWENTSSGELDVESKILGRLNIGGTEVWLTQTVVTTWVIMAILIIIALILRAKMKNYKYKPEGLQNVVEMAIESMHSFVVGSMTEKYAYFGNWFFGVFVFILVSNLSGLLSRALGSLKPYSTRTLFLILSPLYIARTCGRVTCDSSITIK